MHRSHERSCRISRYFLFAVIAVVVIAPFGVVEAALDADTRVDLRTVEVEGAGVTYSSWQEAGRRFVSISKDDGSTWSEPRAMNDTISVAAGVIVPGESLPAVPKGLEAGDKSRVFLVQFETQSLAAWRQGLRDLGVEVLHFVPHNTHLVRMDPGLVSSVEALPFVRWVGSYEPAYRTFPELLSEFEGGSVISRHFNIMTYTAGAGERGLLASEIESIGGQVLVAHPEGYILEAMLSDAQAFSLLASNHVLWIDEWGPRGSTWTTGASLRGRTTSRRPPVATTEPVFAPRSSIRRSTRIIRILSTRYRSTDPLIRIPRPTERAATASISGVARGTPPQLAWCPAPMGISLTTYRFSTAG